VKKSESQIVRFVIALIGIIIGYAVFNKTLPYLIELNITPDNAMIGSILLFALVLGAFGLIAVKVDL
jgi:hypothetical protein